MDKLTKILSQIATQVKEFSRWGLIMEMGEDDIVLWVLRES